MLLELAQWLARDIRAFSVFNYITLRAVMATLDVTDVPVDDPGVVRDVDTPADREAR